MRRIVISSMVSLLGVLAGGCATTANPPGADAAAGAGAARPAGGAAAATTRAAGSRFSDCPDCPEMVVVPPGEFRMGRDGGEPERYEGPVRDVNIGYAFAAGRTEITNAQYRALRRGDRPARLGQGLLRARGPVGRSQYSRCPARTGRIPATAGRSATTSRWPASAGATRKSYVSWLAGVTGKKYRLLTEAEWEYVARAGTPGVLHLGRRRRAGLRAGRTSTTLGCAGRRCRAPTSAPAPCDDGFPAVAPVGSLAPNAFGLLRHDRQRLGVGRGLLRDAVHRRRRSTARAQLTHGCDRRGSRGGALALGLPAAAAGVPRPRPGVAAPARSSASASPATSRRLGRGSGPSVGRGQSRNPRSAVAIGPTSG